MLYGEVFEKKAVGGVNGPHHFSLRGSDLASSGRENPLNSDPCPRGPNLAANTAMMIFLLTGRNSPQLGFKLATLWGATLLSLG